MRTTPAEKRYSEELVYTRTEDGVLLEGAVIRPAGEMLQSTGAPAIVWVHGLTGRFYSLGTVRIGRALAERGFTVITGNNRGHDFGFVLRRNDSGERVLGGGGWELFDESPYDIASWIGFAEELGYHGVVLAGHSLGALKVCYFQALRQDPRVATLVVASPPAVAARSNPALVEQAQRMVAEGRGRDLLPWDISPAGAGTVSAQTYLNRAHVDVDVYGLRPRGACGQDPVPIVGVLRDG